MSKAQRKRPGGGGGSNTVPQVVGLTATATLNGVHLQWNPVPNATSYWIYRNGTPYTIVQKPEYIDAWVTTGTYIYEVAAVVNSVLGKKSSSVTVNV